MSKRPRFPREWSWPGKEKIAFTVGIPFEAFEKQSQVNFVASKGQLDRFSLSYGYYGWKAGIWRLLNILDEYDLKASVSANGLAAERHPQIVRALADVKALGPEAAERAVAGLERDKRYMQDVY